MPGTLSFYKLEKKNIYVFEQLKHFPGSARSFSPVSSPLLPPKWQGGNSKLGWVSQHRFVMEHELIERASRDAHTKPSNCTYVDIEAQRRQDFQQGHTASPWQKQGRSQSCSVLSLILGV